MLFLVVFVLNDPNLCNDILDAWEDAGIRGITILESSGLGRVRQAGLKDDLPLMPSLSDLFKDAETRHRTLFTIINGQEKVADLVNATQSIVGDLENENTGLLFSVAVSEVFGKNLL
jgi:nitrogen regulatory protein PII